MLHMSPHATQPNVLGSVLGYLFYEPLHAYGHYWRIIPWDVKIKKTI